MNFLRNKKTLYLLTIIVGVILFGIFTINQKEFGLLSSLKALLPQKGQELPIPETGNRKATITLPLPQSYPKLPYLPSPGQERLPTSSCIITTTAFQQEIKDFIKSFLEGRNRDLLSIYTRNIDYSDFVSSTITLVKNNRFPNEGSFKEILKHITLFNLQNGTIKVSSSLICSVEVRGNGPFCNGPIYMFGQSEELKANLSIFIPIRGEVIIAGRKIPFSYEIKLYRVETKSRISGFGYDGVFRNGSYWKGASVYYSLIPEKIYSIKIGSTVIRLNNNEEILLNLNDQDIKFGVTYRCRF
ncbi:MAG: hypothetical protein NZ822_01565 [Patescibacteria group bacterium]|nr:hypothetical protein [Patescibacteria group bacterium]